MAKRRNPPPPSGDKVGYKNPPRHSQFKKGQSGNPSGRRKGKHVSIRALLEKIFRKKARFELDQKQMVLSIEEIGVLQFAKRYMEGDPKAIKEYLALKAQFGKGDEEERPQVQLIIQNGGPAPRATADGAAEGEAEEEQEEEPWWKKR